MNHLNARIGVYEILASVFYRRNSGQAGEGMEGRLLRRLAGTVMECCSDSAQCCLPDYLVREIEELSQIFNDEKEAAESASRLNVEYTRLFVTDFPSLWAPPYESYYREGRMMGMAAIDCLSI